MILIAGATGQLGGLITGSLLGQGENVRILVRNSSACEDLVAAGAQPVSGDLKDADSLKAACQGVDAVVTTANSTARGGPDTIESVDRRGNRSLIDAAEATGVRRFVFVSSLGAHPENPVPLLGAKGESEQRLRDSDMTWTVLQPNVFMDILIPIVVGAPALSNQSVTLVGSGERRHSFIAMGDVAAYAAAALSDRHAEHRTLVLGGPEPVSWLDVVAAFERELGHPVAVHSVPPGEPIRTLPHFVTQLLTALDSYDSPIDMGELTGTYGVRPTRIDEWVRRFVLAGRAQVTG